MVENESNTSISNIVDKKDEVTVITRAMSNPAQEDLPATGILASDSRV